MFQSSYKTKYHTRNSNLSVVLDVAAHDEQSSRVHAVFKVNFFAFFFFFFFFGFALYGLGDWFTFRSSNCHFHKFSYKYGIIS